MAIRWYIYPGDSIYEGSILHNVLWQLHYQMGLQSLRRWFSFSTIKMTSRAARYDLMNISAIPGYPNKIPLVYWQTYLPRFNDWKGDDATIHLFIFHKHIHNLGVGCHEYSLMKLFMFSLEGYARSWYEGLPVGSLSSLKYFHTIFHENFEGIILICCYFKIVAHTIESSLKMWKMSVVMINIWMKRF